MARVTSIAVAVRRGVAKAMRNAPAGVFVTSSGEHGTAGRTDVAFITQGVCVSLRKWVVNGSTGQASCKAYHTTAHTSPTDPPAQRPAAHGGHTLSGGTIEELIQSTVMAVALGVYDV